MYKVQSSYFVSVLQILVQIFPKGFPCRIGLQTTRLIEQSIEDLASAEIKEQVTRECFSFDSLRELRVCKSYHQSMYND